MNWHPVNFPEEYSQPWLECEAPLGLTYVVDWVGDGYTAYLAEHGGGGKLWEVTRKTERGAKAACKRHAEAICGDWIRFVGEP